MNLPRGFVEFSLHFISKKSRFIVHLKEHYYKESKPDLEDHQSFDWLRSLQEFAGVRRILLVYMSFAVSIPSKNARLCQATRASDWLRSSQEFAGGSLHDHADHTRPAGLAPVTRIDCS